MIASFFKHDGRVFTTEVKERNHLNRNYQIPSIIIRCRIFPGELEFGGEAFGRKPVYKVELGDIDRTRAAPGSHVINASGVTEWVVVRWIGGDVHRDDSTGKRPM